MNLMYGAHWNEREVVPRETARKMVERVAEKHGLGAKALFVRSTRRAIVYPRQQAMYAIRQRLGWSYPRIARLFGMDHTTVIYGVRQYEKRMEGAADG